ncbi:transposase related to IS5 family (plasmid) [Methylorubrum extorquens DM4]|nr:transposase related to IS5 family [Methylorubrum extorquens DM4]
MRLPGCLGPVHQGLQPLQQWSRRGFWRAMLAALAKAGWAGDAAALDSTYVRAHRSAQGGKGGLARRPSARSAVARR